METLGIILMAYGALCLLIVLLKPPFIYNMAKFKIMEKMMGKMGLNIFVAVWGLLAFVIGYILYT
jgi:hypothetical protein